jgi:hypothetical protein
MQQAEQGQKWIARNPPKTIRKVYFAGRSWLSGSAVYLIQSKKNGDSGQSRCRHFSCLFLLLFGFATFGEHEFVIHGEDSGR